MSEHIDNSKFRKAKLKELILKLHQGGSEEDVRKELLLSLSKIPYGEVVEVEQELISEGLPEEEVLKLCDAHSAVLEGRVDLSTSQTVPEGHPVEVLTNENIALKHVANEIMSELSTLENTKDENLGKIINRLKGQFNQLTDVDKHYQRKEYLIFPYLEKAGITGPPKVMWGKHDEIREQLKGSLEILNTKDISKEELLASADLVLRPAAKGISDMVNKEEEILLPMLMDTLSDADWYEVQNQSLEIGYCLYDPPFDWRPDGIQDESVNEAQQEGGLVQLPSGSFSAEELMAILNTGPFDMTFVDKNDKVKYFTQGKERIFQRNRAILNRDVRHCHPPASAHIVDKILEDFKSGKEERAPFWIQLNGKFIHIEYFALRNEKGEYLGTLEVSQNLTDYRQLEGEQRILSYQKDE
ncbi:MAG TPA: DUF438 domain-containing protein [Prolixibacteraceae bacterium]|nr:DUF438 domain-containing protein [Prolixibacteraceae bacterium]